MTQEFNKRYFITKELAEDLTKLSHSMYDPEDPAREINNPKPFLEILGLKKPLSMQEKLERLFRGPRGLIEQLKSQGEETPEEMNDFEMHDDIDPLSPYELTVMEEENELLQKNETVYPEEAETKEQEVPEEKG
jgi:hypothetical protein